MDAQDLLELYQTDRLTYDDVLVHGLWLEDRGGFSRYFLGEGEDLVRAWASRPWSPTTQTRYAFCVWVNHDTETLADPDDEDGDQGEPTEAEREVAAAEWNQFCADLQKLMREYNAKPRL